MLRLLCATGRWLAGGESPLASRAVLRIRLTTRDGPLSVWVRCPACGGWRLLAEVLPGAPDVEKEVVLDTED